MAIPQNVISHWYQLIENFQASPLEFYKAVEAAIASRQVPGLENLRIEFKEGGILAAKREYLRIIRNKHSFDVCAAPFGTGFFFSWWFTELPSQWLMYFLGLVFVSFVTMMFCLKAGIFLGLFLSIFLVPGVLAVIGKVVHDQGGSAEDAVLAIPVFGLLYAQIFDPATYYKIDTALMFQEAVHNAVMEVIDQMTSSKGARTLSEFERKPILKSFAKSA